MHLIAINNKITWDSTCGGNAVDPVAHDIIESMNIRKHALDKNYNICKKKKSVTILNKNKQRQEGKRKKIT